MKPLVSVVIVNYNGIKYVEHCVYAVLNSTYGKMEVIVVDNGSTDDSVLHLKHQFGHDNRFKVIEIGENRGPAFARNRGIEIADGKYIAFLDNDTEPEPTWLEPLIETMENDPMIGACQCKLLLMKERNKIDYVGDYISNIGFLIQRVPAGEIDIGKADSRDEILSAKSAGMIIRADVFREIGGFDEDYFIYVEETDLCWRVWLTGYRVIFVPESKVYHEFGTSSIILGKNRSKYNAKFHGTKNYILTLFKNCNTTNLITILPLHIFLWLGLAYFCLLNGQWNSFLWIHKGLFWNIANIFHNYKKRKIVQQNRMINDKDLFRVVMKKRNFMYFVDKATSKHKIGNAEGFIKTK